MYGCKVVTNEINLSRAKKKDKIEIFINDINLCICNEDPDVWLVFNWLWLVQKILCEGDQLFDWFNIHVAGASVRLLDRRDGVTG